MGPAPKQPACCQCGCKDTFCMAAWAEVLKEQPPVRQVFIQRAAVNLLSTVLDTPEFFWSAPDIMQTLYKRICEYMELDDRVEVLNNRFAVRPFISWSTSCRL